MSSPQINTFGSRRISSASASRTASANVSSRTAVAVSGIDVLVYLIRIWIRGIDREFHRDRHLVFHFFVNLVQCSLVGNALIGEHLRHQCDRVTLRLPGLFLLL